MYIQIDHEIGRTHGAHSKYVGRLDDDDVDTFKNINRLTEPAAMLCPE